MGRERGREGKGEGRERGGEGGEERRGSLKEKTGCTQ